MNKLLRTSIVLLAAFAFMPIFFVQAVTSSNEVNPQGVVGTNETSGSVKLANPLSVDGFCGLIKLILDGVMIIGMPVAVLFIVFAGFRFIWARGNPHLLETAKKNLLYTIVGIGVFFGAWTIASLITNTINAVGEGRGIEACK